MLTLTDPTRRAPIHDRFDGLFGRLVRDPRDLPFVGLTAAALVVLVPFALVLFLSPGFSPLLAVAYLLVLFLGFIDKYTLMLHCTSHRPLFRKEFGWLNHIIPGLLAPFMGQTPYTYVAHHIGMHHVENNLAPDLSSTLRYQRDSLPHFLLYFGRFFFGGIFELTRYHFRKGRKRHFGMALLGETSWFLLVIALGFLHFEATLVVFVIPLFLMRFLMMAGNWVQHAFVDPADPADPYRNSITCINTRYNRRCYNDGYHVGHHVKASRHWTEMPADFEANLTTYRERDAIVIEGLDYFQIWALLMARRYRTLARRFVDLRETRRSEDEIIALLRARTRPVPRA